MTFSSTMELVANCRRSHETEAVYVLFGDRVENTDPLIRHDHGANGKHCIPESNVTVSFSPVPILLQ